MIKRYLYSAGVMALLWAATPTFAQQVPSPKSHFGFAIGDNYKLANYTQSEAYFKKLAASSDRVKLVDIGKTEEGRSQYMMVITSAENHKNLARYQEISKKLGRAEGLTAEDAKKLAQEGKAVVWIDGGLHSNEVVGPHQLIETAYNLASRNDAETKAILDKVIVLLTHANPDGMELQSDWYMREADSLKRSTSGLPRLYQKYAGHDNNRDFFILNLKETQNMGRQLFVDWIPQIMYNHHQTGPAGTVLAGPPYRDPHNYVFDSMILTGLDAVGAAMHGRLNQEGKPGYTQRNGSVFSTWYNGGLRTTTYFHNIIGLLTEITGGPNPSEIPLVPSRLLPNSDSPNPVTPRKWFFKNAIDYSVSLNYAVLNYAQRHSDELLFNIYQMGKNSIDRGSKDTWALAPKKIDAINAAAQADRAANATGTTPMGGRGGMQTKYFDAVMKAPENRDPRAFIIPADQADLPSAIRFLNALIRTGIEVQKASADFTVNGKNYPKGSFVVKTNQAFRPHILDMFDPQDHPNDFKFEGSAPTPPYDAAGWTLAYLMHVKFDRFLDDVTGPFQKLPVGELIQVPNKALPAGSGYVLTAASNESYAMVNQLMKKGVEVWRNKADGSFYVAASASAKNVINQYNRGFGLNITAGQKPSQAVKLAPSKIAIWDTYGGSMDSGWIRFIMENFNFDATVIYAPDIDKGDLKQKYDVIVFASGAIPAYNPNATAGAGAGARMNAAAPTNIPAEFQGRVGRVSQDKSIPAIKKFIEDGGKVVAIGSSSNLAYHLNLPVKNHLVEMVDGTERRLPSSKYYVPGSVLSINVDKKQAANWGFDAKADVYYDNNPVFKISPSAITSGEIKPLAWFGKQSLRSGWAWGESYLEDGVAAFEAQVGKGKVYVYGHQITFRSQTHGTFKWMFNALYN